MKQFYELDNGDAVKGIYNTIPFEGVIIYNRPHYADHRQWIFEVRLNKPLNAFGQKRESILVTVCTDDGIGPEGMSCISPL